MMLKVRAVEELEECSRVWKKVWPQKCFFDLWHVRACFASSYKRRPYFVVVEQDRNIVGLLALSWVEGSQYFGHFPGETYQSKTWLEQNRIPAQSPEILSVLLDNVPGPYHLRYLAGNTLLKDLSPLAVDEVGYLFFPGNYDFSFQTYMQSFSGKSRKKLGRELAGLEELGVSYRFNHVADIQQLYQMNLDSFGLWSYFADPRFLASFEKMIQWLSQHNMLRITTLMLGGTVAAIDIGAVWENTYTVVAGATDPEFPGVAKMINFHHLQWSCKQRFKNVDFLCGDFGWKKRFHLTSRPLYEINRQTGWGAMHEYVAPDVRFHEL